MISKLENTNRILAIGDASQPVQTPTYITEGEKSIRTAKEVYYQWLSRLVILLTILSLGFFAAASLVLFQLAPQVTVEPFLLIEQDKSENVVRYEPVAMDMPSSKQIMELFIKQYVTYRNTILNDEREMQSRWFAGGIISYLSSPQVFDEFYKKEVEQKLPQILRSRIVREVEVTSIRKTGGEKSRVWTIKFNTYDLSPENRDENTGGLKLKTTYWTASLTAIFIPERMFLSRRLMNPLGFTVIRYSQTEAKVV